MDNKKYIFVTGSVMSGLGKGIVLDYKNIYGIIYKITNLKNGKCYIGQTTKTLFKRIKGHLKRGNKCTKLFRALNVEEIRFKAEVIDKAFSKEQLDKKEIYYIKKFDSIKMVII